MTPVGSLVRVQPQDQRSGNQGCCANPNFPGVASPDEEDRATKSRFPSETVRNSSLVGGPAVLKKVDRPEKVSQREPLSPSGSYRRIRQRPCHERTKSSILITQGHRSPDRVEARVRPFLGQFRGLIDASRPRQSDSPTAMSCKFVVDQGLDDRPSLVTIPPINGYIVYIKNKGDDIEDKKGKDAKIGPRKTRMTSAKKMRESPGRVQKDANINDLLAENSRGPQDGVLANFQNDNSVQTVNARPCGRQNGDKPEIAKINVRQKQRHVSTFSDQEIWKIYGSSGRTQNSDPNVQGLVNRRAPSCASDSRAKHNVEMNVQPKNPERVAYAHDRIMPLLEFMISDADEDDAASIARLWGGLVGEEIAKRMQPNQSVCGDSPRAPEGSSRKKNTMGFC